WDPQWSSFEGYRRIRMDMQGFGRSPIGPGKINNAADVAALLDELGVTGAALVGGSMGGRVCLEPAVARPDLVRALVLMDAGIPGHDWSEEMRASWNAENDAV